jgi:hypothetical protein
MDDWHSRMWLQSGLYRRLSREGRSRSRRSLEAELFLHGQPSRPKSVLGGHSPWKQTPESPSREGDLSKAMDCVTQALRQMEGFELPLAAWQVHGTASLLHERMREPDSAQRHRELSRATIMKLANSMPVEEPLRPIFLSSPAIRKILEGESILIGSD